MGKLKVEARKGPGEGSPLQLSEGTWLCQQFDFGFPASETERVSLCCLSPQFMVLCFSGLRKLMRAPLQNVQGRCGDSLHWQRRKLRYRLSDLLVLHATHGRVWTVPPPSLDRGPSGGIHVVHGPLVQSSRGLAPQLTKTICLAHPVGGSCLPYETCWFPMSETSPGHLLWHILNFLFP